MDSAGLSSVYFWLHDLKRKGISDAADDRIAGHVSDTIRARYNVKVQEFDPPRWQKVTICFCLNKHDKQSLTQTLYCLLKEEFGYDKIENLPATDFPRVLKFIGEYQDIAHKVYDVTSNIERGFVNAVKRQQKVKPSNVYRDVIASLKAPLALLA